MFGPYRDSVQFLHFADHAVYCSLNMLDQVLEQGCEDISVPIKVSTILLPLNNNGYDLPMNAQVVVLYNCHPIMNLRAL